MLCWKYQVVYDRGGIEWGSTMDNFIPGSCLEENDVPNLSTGGHAAMPSLRAGYGIKKNIDYLCSTYT